MFTYETLFSVGEIADKLSILLIKYYKLDLSEPNRQNLLLEIKTALYYLSQYHESIFLDSDKSLEFFTLIQKLIIHNYKQWKIEDLVRQTKTVNAALKARQLNDQRVELKNKISKLFNKPTELKKYLWKVDE